MFYGTCAFDDKNNRVLNGYSETRDDMTVALCLSICASKNFQYSGLEWQCECHCGNEPENGFEWAWPEKCDENCAGNSNQICGGSSALSLWTTPEQEFDGLCVYDNPSNPVLSEYSITGISDLTIRKCKEICAGII